MSSALTDPQVNVRSAERPSLWRNADFVKLWAGQTASLFAAQISTVANINVLTIRQVIAPDRLQGRGAATNRFLAMGIAPIGALGAALGLRTTIVVTTLGLCSALVPLVFSSLARLRQRLPEPLAEEDLPATA